MSHLAEHDTGDHELPVYTTRSASELAAVANALLCSVARKGMKLETCSLALLIGQLHVDSLLAQLCTESELLCRHLLALLVTKD